MDGTNYIYIDCVTASSENMFKNKVDTSQEGGLHIDETFLTLDKPMASLSICNLGMCLRWHSC